MSELRNTDATSHARSVVKFNLLIIIYGTIQNCIQAVELPTYLITNI